MTEDLKKRCLDALNRGMRYCLRASNAQPCVTELGSDKVIPVSELYETIMFLRSMVPSKEEALVLKRLAENDRTMCLNFANTRVDLLEQDRIRYRKAVSLLEPILQKLEVLCGQA